MDVADALVHGGNPGLKPQTAWATELDADLRFPGDATLNVNVFTPVPGQPDARLPVFVWIHGGGYKAGSPASPWYDGRAFNRDGVVTMTLSYRLGFDGFGWIADAPAKGRTIGVRTSNGAELLFVAGAQGIKAGFIDALRTWKPVEAPDAQYGVVHGGSRYSAPVRDSDGDRLTAPLTVRVRIS